ncbi:MAG: AbrB family transcriptional regulator [Qingshengfaniella sp.]
MRAHRAGIGPRALATFGLGLGGGAAFFLLDLPLPWVLGSLTATALAAQFSRFRPTMPESWRTIALSALGIMLGSGFTPETIGRAGGWWISLLAMILLSVLFALMAYGVFTRWGRMDRTTALFAAMPGGLSVAAMLAEDYRSETNRVVLCHTARLVVLLICAPLIIQAISGIDLADASRAAFDQADPVDPLRHGSLIVVGVLSWGAARWIRFPSATLMMPLFASAALHATGILTVHVPPVLSSAAQVAIGAGLGGRFAAYTLRQIWRDGWLAAAMALVMAAGSVLAAGLVAPYAGASVAALFLAYLPGGAPELGVVALALAIDPAMVAAHQVLRVLLIAGGMPLIAPLLGLHPPERGD